MQSCADWHSFSPWHEPQSPRLASHELVPLVTTPFFSRQDLRDPVSYGYLEAWGATLEQVARWTAVSMKRLAKVKQEAEEKDAIQVAPGSYSSNCGQHIVMLNGPWFGTSQGGHATVETASGQALTVHDALSAWATGTPVHALDTEPATKSVCIKTSAEQ